MKFAAIDIGSNAVRLLVSNVFETGNTTFFKKDSLYRVPLRLGDDAFIRHKISEEKASKLVKTMMAFRHLMEVYQPADYLGCATSAMREAENGQEIIEKIKKQADITIEIIDGKREAELLYANHIAEDLNKEKSYLYVDVGGGSTEVTLFSNNKTVTSSSFNIGTVRILHNLVSKSDWKNLKKWLKEHIIDYQPLSAIGSGGNINTIFELSREKEGKPLSFKKLKKIYDFIRSYSLDERITLLGLKPDRADVIIPASEIYLSILQWANISKIYIPQIGLSDGIIHILYEKYKSKTLEPGLANRSIK